MSATLQLPIDPKTLATLKAKAALSGVEMYVVDGDNGQPVFVMTKWAMTRQLSTVDEVEVFLGRIGGRV